MFVTALSSPTPASSWYDCDFVGFGKLRKVIQLPDFRSCEGVAEAGFRHFLKNLTIVTQRCEEEEEPGKQFWF